MVTPQHAGICGFPRFHTPLPVYALAFPVAWAKSFRIVEILLYTFSLWLGRHLLFTLSLTSSGLRGEVPFGVVPGASQSLSTCPGHARLCMRLFLSGLSTTEVTMEIECICK